MSGRPCITVVRGQQVDCVQQPALCRAHHITGFPSIRVFRSGHDDVTVHGMKDHEVPTVFSYLHKPCVLAPKHP